MICHWGSVYLNLNLHSIFIGTLDHPVTMGSCAVGHVLWFSDMLLSLIGSVLQVRKQDGMVLGSGQHKVCRIMLFPEVLWIVLGIYKNIGAY